MLILFLDPIGKLSAMSRRGQDATSSEGSPTEKAKKTTVSAEGETNQLGFAQPVEREGKFVTGLGYTVRSTTTEDEVI